MLLHEGDRVDGRAADLDLFVEVWAGGVAGGSDGADPLPGGEGGPDGGGDGGLVHQFDRDASAAVDGGLVPAASGDRPGLGHDPVTDGVDRRAGRCGEVLPFVQLRGR